MEVRKNFMKLAGLTLFSTILLGVSNQASADTGNLGPVTPKDTIYQIITDRFSDGDSSNNVPQGFDKTLYDGTGKDLKLYQGGDWKGIIDKIPYLQKMGITAVWISAPYENRDTEIIDYQPDGSKNRWTSFHGYHVRNYFATNKHFGTLNQFKELRDALHENGMKLVIDFVTNHTSRYQNPTSNFSPEDGKLYEPDRLSSGEYALDKNGDPYDANGDGNLENLVADPNSDKGKGWFHNFGDRGSDTSKWAFRNKELGSLADFSQENEEVVSYLENATSYWVNLGIDGLRHDATLHMNPAFVKGLKDRISTIDTISHFGEYFIGKPDEKYGDYIAFPKKTGVNNLDFEMYRSFNNTFGNFSESMSDFAKMLQYTQEDYEYENQAVTFLDNHDVSRFGFVQQNSKVYNAALAVLMTSRGIPNIYYGTEHYVKPEDGSDVSGRVFMEKSVGFDTGTDAYKLIGKGSELRKNNNAIAYGVTNILHSDDDVLIYERKFYDDVVVVAVNRQPDRDFTLSNITTSLPKGSYQDELGGLLFGDSVDIDDKGTIGKLTLSGGEVSIWSYKADKAEAPKIGDVISTMGRVGNKVYIHGEGFASDSKVLFGSIEASIESVSPTEIQVRVPDGVVPGYNAITVTNSNGSSNEFIYNVLSGDQNQVIFHVRADTNLGETIHIVGNVPELGSWKEEYSTEAMMNPNHPEWYLPVSLPAGQKIEFKFIKKNAQGQVVWESGVNRTLATSESSTGVLDTEVYNWNN
ncbi:alpha-amylase family glycosyl hydrolase [Streptococcus sp. S784/96/1]|uniref:alpha-amylase family glycosyl hydrolase n=1 Tax=Streptococcus sp. S784/96/1 TaxID=2653499 RepID=UPI0013875892|nr:alpha-amylase family glycosyl hydrolase [Streptococcus sp. S784/96/1]